MKVVSKREAQQVFTIFRKQYESMGYDTSEASLVEGWSEGGHPAICWEGGDAPYEWAYSWDNDATKGVAFCEPYYSCVLVIYPAWVA
jgi:hypothetical protein